MDCISGNKISERIGWVTSCAVDAERFLTGQAYVELMYAKEGTAIGIHQGGALRQAQGELLDKAATGAKVVSRFPKG